LSTTFGPNEQAIKIYEVHLHIFLVLTLNCFLNSIIWNQE